MENVKVAVIGISGNIGQETLKILAEHAILPKQIVALAPKEEVAHEVSYGEDDVLKVTPLENFDFSTVDIALFCAEEKTSADFAEKVAATGCVVIDGSHHFRMDPDVPLIVPEVNVDNLAQYARKNIISIPSDSTTQILVALKPLHDLATIKRLVISTYQSVSSVGRAAMDELFAQTRSIYANQHLSKENFKKQIAFNVIPHIGNFMEDGTTQEEWNIALEIKKVLDPKIKVTATCVRVPVFIGHAHSVNIEFEHDISAPQALQALKNAQGVTVIDYKHEEGFVTPMESAGEDPIYVSRIREDMTLENGLNIWVVGDNLRKGAALNTVQIAQALAKDFL